jgi:hypothetical protein
MISRLPVVTGYEASVRPRRIGNLLDAAGLRDNLVGFGPNWPTIASSRSLLDVLGVSLLVSPLDLSLFGLPAGPPLPNGLVTYRNPTALPRAYLAHRLRGVASDHEAYAAVVDPDFRPHDETIVEGEAPVVEATSGPEFAAIDRDDPEDVSVLTFSSGRALLVVADSWFPGWEAYEHDVALPILRVNYAFRGVVVGKGAHRIDFRYRPRAFRAGVAIAVAAASLALLAAIAQRLRKRAVPA